MPQQPLLLGFEVIAADHAALQELAKVRDPIQHSGIIIALGLQQVRFSCIEIGYLAIAIGHKSIEIRECPKPCKCFVVVDLLKFLKLKIHCTGEVEIGLLGIMPYGMTAGKHEMGAGIIVVVL